MDDGLSTLMLDSHFNGWTNSDWEKFFTFASIKKLKKAQIIFQANKKAEHLFFLISGTVDIIKHDDETIAEYIKGEIFGQLEFMTSAHYDATAISTSDCELLSFPKEGKTLSDFEYCFPEIHAKLMRSFLIFVARRTRKATRLLKENSPFTKQILKQLYSDKLTGLYNKTFLQENREKLFINPSSIIMLKPDNFKSVNDLFGHRCGDSVLVLISTILNREVAQTSKVLRYEGTDFLIITQNQNKAEALKLAKRIKDLMDGINVQELIAKKSYQEAFKLSFSLLVSIFPEDGNDIYKIIKTSNDLIIEARKKAGNQIICFGDRND